ncbi:MAG: TlpA family protein disulfide reductase [Chlorobi bacterium]|nr:TlpA family protein disulfide reductase [Chlorobiota bacterium]
MRKILGLIWVVFNVFYVFSQEKSKILIHEWVRPPSEAEMQAPLMYVDFWATWCAPCISAMPHTEKLAETFGDRVMFLYLSNEPAEKVRNFMKKREKNFISATDPEGKTFDLFGVRYIPRSFLLGPEGEILWEGNPLELNEEILKAYLEKFADKEGNPDRIQFYRIKGPEEEWKVFTQDRMVLLYGPDERANPVFYEGKGEYYLAGPLPFIVSVIKGVPLPYVRSDYKNLPAYRFSARIASKADFGGLVQSFICRETPYKIREEQKETPVLVLEDGENEHLFSAEMYDFEKGDNVPLLDQYAVLVDNATKAEAAAWLTYATGDYYVYRGKDTARYDWNIPIRTKEELLAHLKEELGMRIHSEKDTLTFYRIIKKTDALQGKRK